MKRNRLISGPLFDPTSHYFLKTTYYGPLIRIASIITHGIAHREMTIVLLTRRKLGFVLGTMLEPPKSEFKEFEA